MNKKKYAVLAAAIFLAAGGYLFYKKNSAKTQEPGARKVTVTEGPIQESIEATGSVLPLNRVEIKPPISGRIEKLLADEGDRVQSGQVLAWMSSSDRAAILDAARAQGPEVYKHWEDDYKATPILAPLSGAMILKNVVVGQTVEAGTVLYAMSDSLIVIAQVDESDIGHIKKGMNAKITLDAYPDKPIKGAVSDILYEGKNVSNVITYGVKVRPINAPPFLRSQMTANVSFIMRSKENAVLLSASAVREVQGGGKQVSVPGPDGKPVQKEVTTGIESGDKIEILSGLRPGDEVLLTRGKYTPQQGPQTSPLTMGGRPQNGNSGQAPKQRRQAQ